MAKKAPAAKSGPAVSDCWTVPKAAEKLGVNRSTLASAILRGDIPTHSTACGREMVLLSDCKQFLDNSPGKGFANPEIRRKAGETRGERPKSDD